MPAGYQPCGSGRDLFVTGNLDVRPSKSSPSLDSRAPAMFEANRNLTTSYVGMRALSNIPPTHNPPPSKFQPSGSGRDMFVCIPRNLSACMRGCEEVGPVCAPFHLPELMFVFLQPNFVSMAPPDVCFMQSVVQRRRELGASAKSLMGTSPEKCRQQQSRMATLSQSTHPIGGGINSMGTMSSSPSGTNRISTLVQGGRTFFKVSGHKKLYWSEREADAAAATASPSEMSTSHQRAFRGGGGGGGGEAPCLDRDCRLWCYQSVRITYQHHANCGNAPRVPFFHIHRKSPKVGEEGGDVGQLQ
jgi:hypothetical protein